MRRIGGLVILTAQEHEQQEQRYKYEQDLNKDRMLHIAGLLDDLDRAHDSLVRFSKFL